MSASPALKSKHDAAAPKLGVVDGRHRRAGGSATGSGPLQSPAEIDNDQWRGLAGRAAEANAFYDPDYLGPLFDALGDQRPALLAAVRDDRCIALLPVAWAMRAHGLPLPTLVLPQPFLPLGTPLLADRDPEGAVAALLEGAERAGALALLIGKVPVAGAFARALTAHAAAQGLTLRTNGGHERAALACVGDAEDYLRAGMGGKKLKEYRRLAKRLADDGAVETVIASTPETVAPLLEDFLVLEATGWKGARGTSLGQSAGHAAFIRRAIPTMAATGSSEIIAITHAGRTIAAGIVLYQGDTALFFKIAHDETMARFSPGVLLTLALTRHLFARPDIVFADSTADADHPMIDHIWRERLAVADFAVATRRSVLARLVVLAALGRDALRARAKGAIHRFIPSHRRPTEIPS